MEWYEPGTYIVVPLTSGGLIKKPLNPQGKLVDFSGMNLEKRF
jgi:hypothetical protein